MRKFLGVMVAIALLMGCSYSDYESGDGDFSFLRADFSVVTTGADSKITEFVTDDNSRMKLSNPTSIEGLKADTVYRALVYYDRSEGDVVRLRGYTPVGVSRPKPLKEGETMHTDPVHFTSLWLSENGSYINLCLKLMLGVDDERQKEKQLIGFVLDSTEGNHHIITLLHDQNNIPEYYSYPTYLSMPTSAFSSGDEVTIRINTYDGLLEKTVVVP